MEFNVEPFWDDFNAAYGANYENYMRILFRPGYAVQARELTQIQSILQNQIKHFGDHIFQNGSPVYGGHITLDTNVNYLKLKQTTSTGVDVDVLDFEDRVVFNYGGTAKIRAKVIVADDSGDYPTLLVRYLRGTKFAADSLITTAAGALGQLVSTSDATGVGSVASISEGVFYVDGFFVRVNPSSIVLDAYGKSPTYKIGLEIESEIVDESADANLLDPAQSSFNYQAPGAHRYKFSLNLAKRTLSSIDDSQFFELLRVENGIITKQIDYPIYSEIEKTLARRTYDESGDYTVKDFSISISANTSTDAGSDSTFIANIGPGKAYVKGFEYETAGNQKLTINKARTSNTSTDYDLSVEYGKYIYVSNVAGGSSGLFDITKLDVVQLHAVPNVNVSVASASAYNATYMGNARVLNFDRSGSNYLLYLTDISLTSNTVTAESGSANTIVFPSIYSNLNGAYSNVSIKVLTGSCAGDVRKILTYDGTAKRANVDYNFTSTISNGDKISLLYDIADVDSVVIPDSTITNPLLLKMDVPTTPGKDINGSTVLYDSNMNSLIFPFPEAYVARGTIANADLISRKLYKGITFTSGVATITLLDSGNETFDFGSNGNAVSATAVAENIIVMNRTTGTIITPTVQRNTDKQLVITSGSSTFTGDVYVNVKLNNSEGVTGNRRTKLAKGNTSNTLIRTADSPSYGTSVQDRTSVRIDSSNGYIWFTNTTVINKTSGGATSLCVPDVVNIIKIYDSGNPSQAPSPSNAKDITNNFYLESGQNLVYYDHSKIVLKPGVSPPVGQVLVMAKWYEHSTTVAGYFDVDSYPLADYNSEKIPTYLTSSGVSYNLRDCIDFRLTRKSGVDASVLTYSFYDSKIPKPSEPMELTYSYYLGRKDNIVITKSKELKVIYGIPSKNPQAPQETDDSMRLFTLKVAAYTANPNADILIETAKHKRYTMKDIGNLETRIENLEYYNMLSLSESKAQNKMMMYEGNATQKEKYGTIVDNFSSFAIADYQNIDFSASIDDDKMGPANISNSITLNMDYYNPDLIKVTDKVISLAYTEVPAISQASATANVSVAPYVFGQFNGNLKLTPETDHWLSVKLEPEIGSANPQDIAWINPNNVVVAETPKPPSTNPVATSENIPVKLFSPPTKQISQVLASKKTSFMGLVKALRKKYNKF